MSEISTNSIESSASSPGAILKRCREYHGISLEEAAEATKVGLNYLKALEEDQAKEFASIAYLKGFLRIYASYLGLNPDDIMRIYEKMSAPVSTCGAEQSAEENRGTVRRRFSWQKLALPVCLLLLLIITAAIINRPTTPPTQQAVPKPAIVTQATPVMPSRSSARQAPPAQKSEPLITPAEIVNKEPSPSERNSTQKQLYDPPRGFVVRMKVTQTGTLDVTIDGATPQNYDLVAGDVFEWKAEKNITLDVSNAGGVEAELNGKPLSSFGPVGKPAYIVLDADGIKQ
ncbi:MAG: RodZ domain-containing protein [Pedobacter sp.]